MRLLLRTLQKTDVGLPGRNHEGCQKRLSHTQGKPKRIFPYYYEVDQWQNYNGMDCKSAKQNTVLEQLNHPIVLL